MPCRLLVPLRSLSLYLLLELSCHRKSHKSGDTFGLLNQYWFIWWCKCMYSTYQVKYAYDNTIFVFKKKRESWSTSRECLFAAMALYSSPGRTQRGSSSAAIQAETFSLHSLNRPCSVNCMQTDINLSGIPYHCASRLIDYQPNRDWYWFWIPHSHPYASCSPTTICKHAKFFFAAFMPNYIIIYLLFNAKLFEIMGILILNDIYM